MHHQVLQQTDDMQLKLTVTQFHFWINCPQINCGIYLLKTETNKQHAIGRFEHSAGVSRAKFQLYTKEIASGKVKKL